MYVKVEICSYQSRRLLGPKYLDVPFPPPPPPTQRKENTILVDLVVAWPTSTTLLLLLLHVHNFDLGEGGGKILIYFVSEEFYLPS